MENGLTRGKEVWKEHLSRGMMVLLIALMLSAFCISPVYGYECQDAYNKELYDTCVVLTDKDNHPIPPEAFMCKTQYGYDLLLKDLKKYRDTMEPEEYQEHLDTVKEWYKQRVELGKRLYKVESEWPQLYHKITINDKCEITNLDALIASITPVNFEDIPINDSKTENEDVVLLREASQTLTNNKDELLHCFTLSNLKKTIGSAITAIDIAAGMKASNYGNEVKIDQINPTKGTPLEGRPEYVKDDNGYIHPVKYKESTYIWYHDDTAELKGLKDSIKLQDDAYHWTLGILIIGCIIFVGVLLYMLYTWLFKEKTYATTEVCLTIASLVLLIADIIFRTAQWHSMRDETVVKMVDLMKKHGYTTPHKDCETDEVKEEMKKRFESIRVGKPTV